MPQLILFDIDGTLVLTGGAGGRAMSRAFLDVFGIDDAFRNIPMPGRTDPLILADALMRARIDGHGASRRFRARYQQCLVEEIARPGPRKGVLPGIPELLHAVSQRQDMFLALLTGNYREAARIKLEYFSLWDYFLCGAYGEEAPDRNQLVAVAADRARECGVPDEALARITVIGDTPLDVACARAGGAHAMAVATGGHSVEELRQAGADVVFEDLSDTARVVAALEAAHDGRRR
ncbi:MAG: HAD family hydrolase [Bacteroidales bacterium]